VALKILREILRADVSAIPASATVSSTTSTPPPPSIIPTSLPLSTVASPPVSFG
jgi:hypothetical protein